MINATNECIEKNNSMVGMPNKHGPILGPYGNFWTWRGHDLGPIGPDFIFWTLSG